jgi:hypothetical protein
MKLMPTTADVSTELTQSAAILVLATTKEQESTTMSTAGNSDWWSSTVTFYFKIAVIVLGFVGTVANGTTLFALAFAKQVRRWSSLYVRVFEDSGEATGGVGG